MKTFPIPSSPAPSGGEDKPKPSSLDYAKGGAMKACSYAEGGPVLGRVRNFMKEPSPSRSDVSGMASRNQLPVAGGGGSPHNQKTAYAKAGKGEKGRDKSLKTVMPRK